MAFSSIPGLAQTSQMEYRPFAQDGKIWHCQVGGIKENVFDNHVSGDTLINGEIWKKIVNNDGKLFTLPTDYYAAIRDVGMKVYAIAKGSDKPRLLYDFDLKVGDIVRCGMEGNTFGCLLEEGEQRDSLFGFEFKAYLKVERIDTITNCDMKHKKFTLTLLNAYGEPSWDAEREKFVIGNVIWIEGVGSYSGPFSPWMPLPAHNGVSRSCMVDKTYIFGYPAFSEYYQDWEDWAENSEEWDTAVSSSNHYVTNPSSAIFSLFGHQMTRQPDRGIYIQNGRKFIVK